MGETFSRNEMVKEVAFEDETFRTAPQSLWATRMRSETMLGIAPTSQSLLAQLLVIGILVLGYIITVRRKLNSNPILSVKLR